MRQVLYSQEKIDGILNKVIGDLKNGITIKASIAQSNFPRMTFYTRISDNQKTILRNAVLEFNKNKSLSTLEYRRKKKSDYDKKRYKHIMLDDNIKEHLRFKARVCTRKYRKNHPDRVVESGKKYHTNHPEKLTLKRKLYYAKHSGKERINNKLWKENNKEYCNKYNRERSKKECETLSDAYIISVISKTDISPSTIKVYPELIEIKRTLISINRKLKESK